MTRAEHVLASALLVSASAALVLGACSVGTGTGEITGTLLLRDCGVDLPEYSLGPTFFGADYVTNPGAFDGEENPFVTIRVQRGSYRQDFSDGLIVSVYDVNEVARSLLDVPIPLTPAEEGRERLVDVTFHAGQTCDAGYPDEFWRTPGVLRATGGTITFHALYAPDLDGADTEIDVELTDVEFVSDRPDRRFARLSGFFRFFYQRGPPAQGFP